MVNDMRHRLPHRTALALIKANKFDAPNGVVLVQSFSPGDERFEAYTVNLRLIVTSDIQKNRAVRATVRASAQGMLL